MNKPEKNDSAEDNLARAINEIRASDALVVIGAGASFRSGMPLAGQLAPLVWRVFDRMPRKLEELCVNLGIGLCSAKDALGDDWDRLLIGFSAINEDSQLRREFQQSLTKLDENRASKYSEAHDALSRLIFSKSVVGVVSLNWDTILERHLERRFGIPASHLQSQIWKPHGDCFRPTEEWILLHQPGHIPAELSQFVSKLASERPRTLVIVGYSESDEVVVDQLISPISNEWRVFRISPSATGEGAIEMDAGKALQQIADQLAPTHKTTGWKAVSFSNQRGIETAILGERLGPADVESCPTLPHLQAAQKELNLLHKVQISGTSGCGKSITA